MRHILATRLILIVVLAIVPALLLALATGLRQRAMLVEHASEVAVRLTRDVADDGTLIAEGAQRLASALATNPIVLGSGKRVFPSDGTSGYPKTFELAECRQLGTGSLILIYRRAAD